MTNGNGNRDDELEIIRQLLIATANRTESNSKFIDRLTERVDQTTVNVDRLGVKVDQLLERVDQTTVNVDRLGVKVDQLSSRVDNLTTTVERLATDALADREVMMGMLEQIGNIQHENRQILEYLFGQQRRNGNGGQRDA